MAAIGAVIAAVIVAAIAAAKAGNTIAALGLISMKVTVIFSNKTGASLII